MAVLVRVVVPQLDAAAYDGIMAQLGPALGAAKGLRAHAAHPSPDGWTVVDVWDSTDDFRAFFDANVAANLPPGTTPEVTELHNFVLPA